MGCLPQQLCGNCGCLTPLLGAVDGARVLGRVLWVFLSSPLHHLVGFCSLSEWRGEAPKAALSCHLTAFPIVATAS